jgi:siroheme synthase (precorrin-2 oxidase/ferrochelatase)
MIKNSVKSTLVDYFLKHRTQPVIVFMETDDEKLVKMIKKMAKSLPGKFYSVTTEDGLSYAIN